jgi:spore coat polysaccharide biosynthesis protein SpsF
MQTLPYRIFVQARMSSARFPGKMLADLLGQPLISHVVNRLTAAGLGGHVVVLTSVEPSDDPLADHVERRCGVPVFRGELRDVAKRFRDALDAFSCEWVVRINGDSPLIDGGLIGFMLKQDRTGFDLISNVFRRTFPPGQSVECIRASALSGLRDKTLTEEDREHVTPYFYRHATEYRLKSIVSTKDFAATAMRLVVDTPEDLREIAGLIRDNSPPLSDFSAFATVEI